MVNRRSRRRRQIRLVTDYFSLFKAFRMKMVGHQSLEEWEMTRIS